MVDLLTCGYSFWGKCSKNMELPYMDRLGTRPLEVRALGFQDSETHMTNNSLRVAYVYSIFLVNIYAIW